MKLFVENGMRRSGLGDAALNFWSDGVRVRFSASDRKSGDVHFCGFLDIAQTVILGEYLLNAGRKNLERFRVRFEKKVKKS